MKHEKSCGAILYQTTHQVRTYLLIQHQNGGHWAFTKGHVENHETEAETAQREIYEEVGLSVEIDPHFRKTTSYSPEEGIIKEVVYFVAPVLEGSVSIQEEEVCQFTWLPYQAAMDRLTYPNDQALLQAAENYLNGTL